MSAHSEPADSRTATNPQTVRRDHIVGVLSKLAMFSNVDEALLQRVAQDCRRVHVARGDYLFTRGTASRCFYGVESGLIELSLSNSNGETKVLEIISPGQSLGEAVMFLQRPFPVDARSLATTQLLEVPAATVNTLLSRDPHFARTMLASMSLRLHNRVRDIEMFTLNTAKQRTVGFLLGKLADQTPHTGERVDGMLGDYLNHPPVDTSPHDATCNDGGVIELPAAKAKIASRLGMTPETFSRVLAGLAADGQIAQSGRTITITDPAALAAHAAL